MNIALFSGGPSAEREVSLKSGTAVAEVLRDRGHAVQMFDPVEGTLPDADWNTFDIAFIALHGTYGEDGQVQQQLDQVGLRYTGCNADVSKLAFSKWRTKSTLASAGIRVPPGIRIEHSTRRIPSQLGLPLAVKPDRQGSSVGVSIIFDESELPTALERAFDADNAVVIERGIIGSEWTVSMLDREPLSPIRIETPRGFYDYQAKYEEASTSYHFDGEASLLEELQHISVRVADALQLAGATRIDFRVDETAAPFVLEANTIPGLTAASLLPKAAKQAGMSFSDLCEWTAGNAVS